jgi:1-acyl-sn-glycerol-3-phosphate acyltransferase
MMATAVGTALAAACRVISGPSVEWRCDPGDDVQRIYFANHSSHLDFIVIWSALPPRLRRRTRPVAGRDYWERSAIRRHLAGRVFRAVLVERHGNLEPSGADQAVVAARATVERLASEMADRDSLIVFPEGTRSVSGEIGPFRSGLYHLARARPDAEVIPVHLENLNRILPRGEALPVPMLSRVIFGPPLPAIVDESKDAFLVRSRTALLTLTNTP